MKSPDCFGGAFAIRLSLNPWLSQSATSLQERAPMSELKQRRSLLTTGGIGRAPARAMLRGVGFLDDDFDRPMIGVASLFSDITPCNAHLDRLRPTGGAGSRARRGRPLIIGWT